MKLDRNSDVIKIQFDNNHTIKDMFDEMSRVGIMIYNNDVLDVNERKKYDDDFRKIESIFREFRKSPSVNDFPLLPFLHGGGDETVKPILDLIQNQTKYISANFNTEADSATLTLAFLQDSHIEGDKAVQASAYKMFRDACFRNDINTIKKVIDDGVNVNETGELGHTALMEASDKGYVEIAKILIENGADVNARSQSGDSALMCAASSGSTELAKLLIKNGADTTARDRGGWTAFQVADSRGHKELASLLAETRVYSEVANNISDKVVDDHESTSDNVKKELPEDRNMNQADANKPWWKFW